MNRTEKRQYDLRNKLIAAIAMLLVSTIMMVSTTYAWFTLSTAPEVQGITTTVGANGNLEIALSPYSGEADKVTSAMGDANLLWKDRNLTWGNLLSLEDNSIYGLSDVKLLPARLNFTGNAKTGANVDAASPLLTPIYGADGRPSTLQANTAIGSKHDNAGVPVDGFGVSNAGYGVRVVGTSDTMTEYQITFNEALSDLANAISNSNTAAANSLNGHGTTLAGVMINYGLENNDVIYGETELAHIEGILDELEQSNAYLLAAIKAALLAEAASDPGVDGTFSNDRYTAAKAALTDAADIDTVKTYASSATAISGITSAIAVYEKVAGDLENAQTEFDKLGSSATFDDLKPILNYVMKTEGVTINNWKASELKANQSSFAASAFKDGINIKMGAGSGVYADLSSAVGNFQATVAIPEFKIGDDPYSSNTEEADKIYANMTTTSAVNGGYMPVARTEIASDGAYAGADAGSAVISVPYAYMIDFMFRTNAQGSSLKLQTSDAQRVYSDSESTATQGMGSEMTFAVTDTLSLEATLNLMKSIRVVFTDTATREIYGIGKLDITTATYKDADGASVNVTIDEKGITGGETVATVVANLYLYNYEFEEIMEIVKTPVLGADDQPVPDEDGNPTYTEEEKGTGKYNLVVTDSPIDESVAVLCALPANTAKKITTMVYLDGDSVTNADVANGTVSLAGTMNLQFSSTAVLVPMENTALKDMKEAGQFTAKATYNGQPIGDDVTVKEGESYSLNITDKVTAADKTLDDINVVVTMKGETVADAYSNGVITINNVTGDIVVTVTDK